MTMTSKIFFHKFAVTSQVFYQSKFTYALVNLKPLVPGHVLVVPLRVVPRLKDLTCEESIDYMQTIQVVHSFIEKHYKADAMNISMQDGLAAGQSVPHVHTHIIPRYLNDNYNANNNNDQIYSDIQETELRLAEDYVRSCMKPMQILEDEDRKPRSMEIMESEAKELSDNLQEFIKLSK